MRGGEGGIRKVLKKCHILFEGVAFEAVGSADNVIFGENCPSANGVSVIGIVFVDSGLVRDEDSVSDFLST